MAEITVPDQSLFVDKQWSLDIPAQQNRSGWTGRSKVVGLPGAETWRVTGRVRFRPTERMQRPWRAFFLALRGIQNTFRIRAACQTHIGPPPVVDAGAGDAYTLPLKGMAVSTTILEAGQWMTVPLPSGYARLVCLTADLITDASGEATAQFEPALGEAPAEDAVVETAEPYTLVRQANPSAAWQGGDFRFEAVEAL